MQQPATVPTTLVTGPNAVALAALEVLNESPEYVYALTFNSVTHKWLVIRLKRERMRIVVDEGEPQPAMFTAMLFSAGGTPNEAARDALRLRYAPERTVDSDY